jgi:hypothetical protein
MYAGIYLFLPYMVYFLRFSLPRFTPPPPQPVAAQTAVPRRQTSGAKGSRPDLGFHALPIHSRGRAQHTSSPQGPRAHNYRGNEPVIKPADERKTYRKTRPLRMFSLNHHCSGVANTKHN